MQIWCRSREIPRRLPQDSRSAQDAGCAGVAGEGECEKSCGGRVADAGAPRSASFLVVLSV